jgi:SH3-like domain-containing protein
MTPKPADAALRMLALAVGILAATASAADAQQQDTAAARRTLGASGLPLPRFASVASGEANVRTGPGMEYPIRWVYNRPGLPVRILQEDDVWRLVEDADGEQGWAHSSLLSTQRTVLVRGGTQAIHRKAGEDSRVILRAEEGVVGEFVECGGDWCRVEIADRRGWLPRANLWGVLPGE